MARTGLDSFDATVQETNHVLKVIEDANNWKGRRGQAYMALRAVLLTLRDRLPVAESVNLAAQLPMLIRGMYFEGWKPNEVPKKMDQEEFVERIRERFPMNLAPDVEMEDVIQTVLTASLGNVSQGELEDIKGVLPKDISRMI